MNQTLEVIKNRYSCRSFAETPLTDEEIRLISEAGVQAPSGNNSQRWRVIAVKDKDLLAELDAEAMRAISEMEDKTLYDRLMDRGGTVLYHAPCVVYIPIPSAEAELDCGIVSENIALAAASLGIASCICGLARFSFSESKSAYFKERLCFPDGYDFGMSVLLGTAKAARSPHTPDTSKITIIG